MGSLEALVQCGQIGVWTDYHIHLHSISSVWTDGFLDGLSYTPSLLLAQVLGSDFIVLCLFMGL